MDYLIKTHQLTKQFKTTTALNQELFFVTRVTFIKSLHKEEQLFNSPHKPLMKPIQFGRPMASKLRLPVTGMEILTYSLCLLTEVPPGD